MVTVKHKATSNTAMLTHCERFLYPLAASGAILRRERGGYFPYSPSSILSFGDEYLKKSIPCRITDGLRKVVIPEKSLDVQFFNPNIIKLADELIAQLVKEVSALIGDVLMVARKDAGSFTAIRAARSFLAHLALRDFQFTFRLAQVFRIFDDFASRKRSEVFNADINANSRASLRDVRQARFFNRKNNKPTIGLPREPRPAWGSS